MVDINTPEFSKWLNEIIFKSPTLGTWEKCDHKKTCKECKAFSIKNEIYRKIGQERFASG